MKIFKTQIIILILVCWIAQTDGSAAPKKDTVTLTLMQNIAIGGAAGATEVVSFGQIASYFMNQIIQGKPISRNPFHWYRGSAVNAASMAPITAVQKVVDAHIRAQMKAAQEHDLSAVQKMTAAFVAGTAGACIATPTEAIPVYMQKPENVQKTTLQATQDLRLRAWRGFGATAMRDGLFTIGYMALAPIIQERTQAIIGQSSAASVAGGVTAGLVTAVATQPFAVVKTALQADHTKQKYSNAFDVIRATCAQEGFTGLYKGLTARGARIMVAIPVLTKAGEAYTAMLTQYK